MKVVILIFYMHRIFLIKIVTMGWSRSWKGAWLFEIVFYKSKAAIPKHKAQSFIWKEALPLPVGRLKYEAIFLLALEIIDRINKRGSKCLWSDSERTKDYQHQDANSDDTKTEARAIGDRIEP